MPSEELLAPASGVCIPNIGPRERRRRMTFGLVALAVGASIGLVLALFEVSRPLRLGIFIPLWMGAIGVMQAHEKTCIALVKRGERNMDAGAEGVSDPSVLRQLRLQARKVHAKSLVFAAVMAALLIALP